MKSPEAPASRDACYWSPTSSHEIAALEELLRSHVPKPVPADYSDRVVSIFGPDPRDRAQWSLAKAYKLKPGRNGGALDDWTDETRLSQKSHSLGEVWLDDLADFIDLSNALGKQRSRAIVLGRLKDTSRNPMRVDDGAWLVSNRTLEHYEDARSRWFPLDLDHLPGDALDVRDVLVDYLDEVLPELSGCAFVAAHTASSGIKGARIRLWFELGAPRFLVAMAAYAKSVNKRAGFKVVDEAIYSPGHFVLTAAPLLLNADGKKVRRPVPSEAWYVPGDLVPADAIPDVLPGDDAAYDGSPSVPLEQLSKVEASELLAAFGPHNYNVNIHRWLCSQAFRAREDSAEADFASAYATIVARIHESSEPDQLDRRLREHANSRELRRRWDAARQRKRELSTRELIGRAPVAPAMLPTTSPSGSIGTLRINTAGAADLRDLFAQFDGDDAADDAEASGAAQSPQPTVIEARAALKAMVGGIGKAVLVERERGHWLLTHPPGVGKTEALMELVTPGFLLSNLVRVSVSNHRLAAELIERLRARARSFNADPRLYGDLAARIRHHKGRRQPGMCPDDESRPKADTAEELGVSPRKAVCPNCATGKAGRCPWLKQEDDNETGIVVEVHSSVVAHKAARRTDLRVIDEDILSSVVGSTEDADADMLSAIGSIRKKPNGLGSLGAILRGPTLTLHGYRKRLSKTLRDATPRSRGAAGVIPVSGLTEFDEPATFKARSGFRWETRTGTALDEAAELESQLQDSLARQIIAAEDAPNPRVSPVDLRKQLRASQLATKLYELITASMKAEREYVFGLAVFSHRARGRRQDRIKLATRDADVGNLFGEASITLDGTANEAIWRALVSPTGTDFPSAVLGASPAISAGGLRAVQYADRVGAKSSLRCSLELSEAEREKVELRDALGAAPPWARELAFEPGQHAGQLAAAASAVARDTDAREARKLRSDANLAIIRSFACFKAAEKQDAAVAIAGRQVSVLLIAQKEVVETLVALGLPDNVACEHFGALRGLDGYRRVPVVIVVGRIRPQNIDLELMTEALYMHDPAVKSIDRYAHDASAGRPWQEAHPDPMVRVVQLHIAGAEVKQAVARARLFDRDASCPCEVHVFGKYDLGIPESLMQRRCWGDASKSPVEIALARGVVLADMRLNQGAHADVFPRGAKDGKGRVDRERRAEFVAMLGRLQASGRMVSQPLLRDRGDQDLSSLLGIETLFDGDASRRYRLVKLRTPASRKGSFAIVRADWREADVAQQLGMPIVAWLEQSSDALSALAGLPPKTPAVGQACAPGAAGPAAVPNWPPAAASPCEAATPL